jgi:hypothetical protein
MYIHVYVYVIADQTTTSSMFDKQWQRAMQQSLSPSFEVVHSFLATCLLRDFTHRAMAMHFQRLHRSKLMSKFSLCPTFIYQAAVEYKTMCTRATQPSHAPLIQEDKICTLGSID